MSNVSERKPYLEVKRNKTANIDRYERQERRALEAETCCAGEALSAQL